MRCDSMNYAPIHATRQAVWEKAKRMNALIGRWKNFRNFRMQLWINEILGWHAQDKIADRLGKVDRGEEDGV